MILYYYTYVSEFVVFEKSISKPFRFVPFIRVIDELTIAPVYNIMRTYIIIMHTGPMRLPLPL